MKRILLIAALTVTVLSVALGQMKTHKANKNNAAEQEVKQVHKERLQALVNADISKLDKIVGDDLIYISPTGKVQTKAEIVSDVKSGALKVSSIEQGDANVRIYGNTAVVTYLATAKFVDNGREYNNQIRSTSVYVKRNGHWQLVSQQLTRVTQ
ncbi:MAG TPA: nuclear transport factor 2 family protein [Pyrinomonadaceae bacterium]|nr:nuclear transport factor 2 family protein [Pyrinomonadaceae bacterium]